MCVPSGLAAVVAAALTALVGALIAFGHRYSDRSIKFDEKAKADELMDIRTNIRYEVTMPALDRLWKFLRKTSEEAGIWDSKSEEVRNWDIKSLLYDTTTRDQLNDLIDNVEKTLKEGVNVREVSNILRIQFGRLGNSLYGFALIVGVIGYPLLYIDAASIQLTFGIETCLLWALFAFIGATILFWILRAYNRIRPYMKVYQTAFRKYKDEARIRK